MDDDEDMLDRECPECDGQCYDADDYPCRLCFGEGYILTLAVARARMVP